MCNLYSVTTNQAAIVAFTRAIRDRTGNLPPMPGVFPRLSRAHRAQRTRWRARIDAGAMGHAGTAAVRRSADHQYSQYQKRRTGGRGLNPKIAASCRSIRSANMPIPSRVRRRPGSRSTRIGRSHSLPEFGRPWHGKRGTKANPVEGEHQLFGFLTTDANAEVRAIHPKAMPVIRRSRSSRRVAYAAGDRGVADAEAAADGTLKIVARGEKEDGALPELTDPAPRLL